MLTALEDAVVALLENNFKNEYDTKTRLDEGTKSIYVPIHKKGAKYIGDSHKRVKREK